MLWRQACLVQSLDLLLPRLEANSRDEAALRPLLLAFCGLMAAAPASLVRLPLAELKTHLPLSIEPMGHAKHISSSNGHPQACVGFARACSL